MPSTGSSSWFGLGNLAGRRFRHRDHFRLCHLFGRWLQRAKVRFGDRRKLLEGRFHRWHHDLRNGLGAATAAARSLWFHRCLLRGVGKGLVHGRLWRWFWCRFCGCRRRRGCFGFWFRFQAEFPGQGGPAFPVLWISHVSISSGAREDNLRHKARFRPLAAKSFLDRYQANSTHLPHNSKISPSLLRPQPHFSRAPTIHLPGPRRAVVAAHVRRPFRSVSDHSLDGPAPCGWPRPRGSHCAARAC